MEHRRGHVWTANKLDFLKEYLPAFNVVVRKYFPHSIYVDGYSGPGMNDINGEIREGSPLIALGTNPQFTRLYFVEKKPTIFRNLEEHINRIDLDTDRRDQVHLINDDFNDVVRSILMKLPNHPAFFFLDPEGLELDWATVELIGRRQRADLFILISAGGVTRCAGKMATHDRVTKFYGHDRWKPIGEGVHEDRPIGLSKFQAFLDLYLEGLQGLGFTHVRHFLIARNSQNASMHALVFASKNDTAIKIATHILKKIQREQHGASPLFDL